MTTKTLLHFSLFDFNADTDCFESFQITNGKTLEQIILKKQEAEPLHYPIEYVIEDDILIIGTQWIFHVMSCVDYSSCILKFDFDKEAVEEYNSYIATCDNGMVPLVDEKLFTVRTDIDDDTYLEIDTSESSERVVFALNESRRKLSHISRLDFNEDDNSNFFTKKRFITVVLNSTIEILCGSVFYDE